MLSLKDRIETHEAQTRWQIGFNKRQVASFIIVALLAGFALGFLTSRLTTKREPSQALLTKDANAAQEARTNFAASALFHPVAKVVRPDVLEIEGIGGVRLIGIDIPQDKPHYSEQFKKATEFVEKTVLGKKVRLAFDPETPSLPAADDSGYIPAYVYLEDETLFNAELLRQGKAFVKVSETHRFADEFRAAEKEAVLAMRGLWSPDASATIAAAPAGSAPNPTTSPLATEKKKLSPLAPADIGPNLPAFAGSSPSPVASGPTAIISSSDKMYHQSGCTYLGKTRQSIVISEARAKGYTACGRCFPSTVLKPN